MTDISWHPGHADLESLFINNQKLDRLDAYPNRFNPIRIMRMEGMEVRHSNILGWLLDPLETHGLGDRFLKSFLSEALKGESAKGRPTALDIVQGDLRDIEVRREWQHIDLFLLSRRNNWAFIIENKFHSAQHKGQLAKYMQKVRSAFEPEEGALEVKGIFLTLHDEDPEDSTYASIGYIRLNRNIQLEDLADRSELRLGGRAGFARFWSVYGSAIVDLTTADDTPDSTGDGWTPIRHRIGVEYEDECFRFGVGWRRDYIGDRDFQPGNTFLITLAFKTLGR